MNEMNLFNLQEQDDGSVAVSGRELHAFLEVKTRYNDWFSRMKEYGLEENIDYQALTQKRVTAQGNMVDQVDHVLTIDTAKEISMIQRNEKGKQARQYFIQVEKAWNSPEMIMKRALQIADRKVIDLQEQIALDKPKVIFADAVSASHTSILVGELSKLLRQNGVDIGQNRLFSWLRENGFLIRRKGTDFNMPTQKSMDLELFEIKERTINNADGSIRTTRTPKVTGKGQQYFINKFLKELEQTLGV
ncbi:phage antirepressor KilAC domain-containing protein [Aerococcus viridans]|uniref:phage antirepressor KilAC domain-containing protein n=1 Tax=Aerococcus viridans TaxID=1377 RepID=UPI0021AF6EB7|nr:phage antirepressor KilAC domain-containing protein [Aerococcus viridans]MCT1798447.1 phage antirepressor KilAC domain-containing protein [Aerococcus viridans]